MMFSAQRESTGNTSVCFGSHFYAKQSVVGLCPRAKIQRSDLAIPPLSPSVIQPSLSSPRQPVVRRDQSHEWPRGLIRGRVKQKWIRVKRRLEMHPQFHGNSCNQAANFLGRVEKCERTGGCWKMKSQCFGGNKVVFTMAF